MKNKNIIHRSLLAAFLIAVMLLVLVGCDVSKEQTTTEVTSEDDNLLDTDGFRAVKDYVVTIQDGVDVRVDASVDADTYITLDSGVDLNRTGVKDGWARVQINGGIYYVESRFVEETTIKWATETDVDKVSHVVFIDPAKQITEDTSLEPMSPDIEVPSVNENGEYEELTASQNAGMKAKMTAGAIGKETGSFEYDVTMSVANKLNAELVKRGYTVYLSRTTNNVNLSNAKRVQMANASGAEIYIKLEAPGANDPSASGILGFITTSTNSHTGTLYQKNYELCYDVLRSSCEQTGATRMGIYETDNLTSLNYSDMPATVLSIGFLSNTNDDIALSTEEYQKKLVVGIANGLDEYFENIDE